MTQRSDFGRQATPMRGAKSVNVLNGGTACAFFSGAFCLSSGGQPLSISGTPPQRSTPRAAFRCRSGSLKHLAAFQAGSLAARKCCQRHWAIVAQPEWKGITSAAQLETAKRRAADLDEELETMWPFTQKT
jgi:hypothetical protein